MYSRCSELGAVLTTVYVTRTFVCHTKTHENYFEYYCTPLPKYTLHIHKRTITYYSHANGRTPPPTFQTTKATH